MERMEQVNLFNEEVENPTDTGLSISLPDSTHEALMNELVRQSQNRADFYVPERTGRFHGFNFVVEGVYYPLDPISLTTLVERIKMSGTVTVSRKGLLELSDNPDLFANVANFFYNKINKPIQFRTMFNYGIAFPSKNYTIVNHLDLMNVILETLSPIFGNNPTSSYNYLDKRIMYSFIPIPGAENIPLRTFNGETQNICLGLEVRNSEILERAVVVTFKLLRLDNHTGIILNSKESTFYQRHMGMTTHEALENVRNEVINMFQNQLEDAINTIDTLRTLMETVPENGPETAKKFTEVLGLDISVWNKIIDLARISGDNTVYGWTIGPLTQLSMQYSNRETQENYEKEAGKILMCNEMLNKLLS